MAYRFVVHDIYKTVYKQVWDEYDDTQSAESYREWEGLAESNAHVADYHEFHNLLDVTDYRVTVAQIRRLASLTAKEYAIREPSDKRVAYVVPNDVSFGTGRIYSALVTDTGENVGVFRDMYKGGEWLGLTPEQVDEIISQQPPDAAISS